MNQLEVNSYHFWFDWLEEKFFNKPDGIIYLRCSPEKCYERMNKRNRSEESSVPLSYLKELHNLHDEWILNEKRVPVLMIDNENDDDWTNIMDQINNFI
jgi:deoxyadenosine/deoxycytidine kinase